MLKVIFDRSSFHGARFENIEKSPLRDLCRHGRIEVFHTPIFLEETLSTYRGGHKEQEWRKHLQFSLDICNGGIFLDREEIWHNELVAGRGPFARHLLPECPNKNYDSRPMLIERLQQVAASGDLSKEWLESGAMREDTRSKKNNQKTISRVAREEVAGAIRERRVTGSLKNYSFTHFRKSEFVRTGKALMDLVDTRRAAPLADQWAQNPDRFPFYSAFVEGYLYAFYYAAVEHNYKIDRNAQLDYELLAYLTWADLVVSDDHKFFRHAFEAIWEARGKRIETSESFVVLTERLAI